MNGSASPTVRRWIRGLASDLSEAGLDLMAAAPLRALNEASPPTHQIQVPWGADAHALVIGNTIKLWRPFVQALSRSPDLAHADHPLDTWVARTIRAGLARCPVAHDLRLATDPPPRAVALQPVAQAAGLAWLSPAHLNVHPTYGPWIALRAVILLDAPPPPRPSPPPSCAHCRKGCQPALSKALARSPECDDQTPPSLVALRARWRRWVAVRDACPTGRAWRYAEDQLTYHYTADRRLLTPLLGPPDSAVGCPPVPSPEGVSMKPVDVPQANNLSTVRRIAEAVAEGARDALSISDQTGYSLRHARYRLHAARILQLVSLNKEGALAVTALGARLLTTEPGSPDERAALAHAIEHSPTIQAIAPELLAARAPSIESLADHLYHQARLGRSTAMRRASGLLTWRRRVLNEVMPRAAHPPVVGRSEQLELF